MVLVVPYWIPRVGKYESRNGMMIGTCENTYHIITEGTL